jgi:ATP-dependent DNA helicase RecG
MSDEDFLTHLKLMVNGQLTNTAILLLGKEEHDYLFNQPPKIMWRLFENDEVTDYGIYAIPFINVIDRVLKNIRNRNYQYMVNKRSQNPAVTSQYDVWLLHELMNNYIAHSNHRLGGRIYLNEFIDRIIITNPGDFIPRRIENILQARYNPPFYRNQLLAEAMVKLTDD